MPPVDPIQATTNLIIMIGLYFFICNEKAVMASPKKSKRIIWELSDFHVHRDDPIVIRALRMHPDSFDKLVSMLTPALQRGERMGKLHGGRVSPHMCVFVTIRWLAGRSYLDICKIAGIGKSTLMVLFEPQSTQSLVVMTLYWTTSNFPSLRMSVSLLLLDSRESVMAA